MSKRALVTGATGQLGTACCEALEKAGWEAVRTSRSLGVDLTKENDGSVFVNGLKSPFDLVIFTHGTQKTATIGGDGFADAVFSVVNSNLVTVIQLTDALIYLKKINPGGLFIFCSSIHATHPRKGRAPYAIAKAGLEALVRVLALEQAENNIRAVALRLGQMTRPMAGVVFTPEQEAAIRERTPLEWVDPADVAKLCLGLYEQKSLSGAVIDVDSAHSLNVWP